MSCRNQCSSCLSAVGHDGQPVECPQAAGMPKDMQDSPSSKLSRFDQCSSCLSAEGHDGQPVERPQAAGMPKDM